MIAVVIPTLETQRGKAVAQIASATAGCEAQFLVITDRERTGFTRTTNRGMRAAGQIETCLLNDDVAAFRQGWLSELHSRLVHSADIGLIGPGAGRGYWLRTPESWPHDTYRAEHLSFWCVLIRQETRRMVGLLDESYIHYSSDYAYCDTARQLGWEIALSGDLGLMHEMGGSGGSRAWMGHDLGLYDLRKRREDSAEPYASNQDIVAFEGLLKALKPRRVLEWGAGYSTLCWPPKIVDLECWVSVEHNYVYWNRFRSKVGGFVDLRLLNDGEYLLPAESQSYDLVIVDGIRRDECLIATHRLIKPGGMVLLHDWGRRDYQKAIATYAEREVLTFGTRLEKNGDATQGFLILRDS